MKQKTIFALLIHAVIVLLILTVAFFSRGERGLRGRHRHHRHVPVDQRDGSMFHLTRRVTLAWMVEISLSLSAPS
jgi:hypothetical protein